MTQPAARRPSRWRRSARTVLGLLLATALVASACSSSSKAEDEGRQGTPEPVAADDGALALVPGGVQQLWVLDRVIAVDLDGTEQDVTEAMVTQAREDLDDAVEITEESRFSSSSALEPQMLDRDGSVIEAVVMTAGVLEAEDDAKLAVLATPADGRWLIDRGYTLRLDLPTTSGVVSGTPLVVDYAHVRYLPVEGADGLGDDIDPVKLWQDRAAVGAIFYPTDLDGDFQLMTAEAGVARHIGSSSSGEAEDAGGDVSGGDGLGEDASAASTPTARSAFASLNRPATDVEEVRLLQGSADDLADAAADAWNDELIDRASKEAADKLDIPPDALPLLEGIRAGARSGLDGKCRSATCIKNLTKEIEKGFKESWERIEEQLRDPEPENDPDLDPSPTTPPGPKPGPKPPGTPIDPNPPGGPGPGGPGGPGGP